MAKAECWRLYSAALDERIAATVVSGYFGPREKLWEEPIDRNVWTLLREFGDAEIAPGRAAYADHRAEHFQAAAITAAPPGSQRWRSGHSQGARLQGGTR